MANAEHVEILSEGIESWNEWRRQNPEVIPDLSGVDLRLRDMTGVNLRFANLHRTDLEGAILDSADLRGYFYRRRGLEGDSWWKRHFPRTDLRGANLENTNTRDVRYNRRARYRGIRIESSYSSPMFRRFAQDQDYIEEFRHSTWRFPIYLLWLAFTDCGRSFSIWAFWSLFVAVFFGLQYHSLGDGAFHFNGIEYGWYAMYYYSVVTFTTLGFGDIVPLTEQAALWVSLEVLTGYLMLGGLISLLGNKLVRRS